MTNLVIEAKGDHKIGVYIAAGGKNLNEEQVDFLKDCEKQGDQEGELNKIVIYDEDGNYFTGTSNRMNFLNALL